MSLTATLALVAVAVLTLPAPIAAHPGHGEIKMLSGKVIAIEAGRIQLDVFDRATFSQQKIWVFVDDKTKVQAGKARMGLADLRLYQMIDCMAETEIGKDDAPALRALQIRLKRT